MFCVSHACVLEYVCTCACMRACMCVCSCMRACVRKREIEKETMVHAHPCTRACACVFVCISLCVCVFVHAYGNLCVCECVQESK